MVFFPVVRELGHRGESMAFIVLKLQCLEYRGLAVHKLSAALTRCQAFPTGSKRTVDDGRRMDLLPKNIVLAEKKTS